MNDIDSKIIEYHIGRLQPCENLPTSTLRAIYDKLINLIINASSKKISDSIKDYKAFVTNGNEKENMKEIDAKRITKEKVRTIITQTIKQDHDTTPVIVNTYLPTLESNPKNTFQDISEKDVKTYTEKIVHGKDSASKRFALKRLEVLAKTYRLWKHDDIWDALGKEIHTDVRNENLVSAIYLLKRMLSESKAKSDGHDEVVSKTRQILMKSFEGIISSTDVIWIEYKDEAKQILQYITNEHELFLILWNAWKKCVYIKDNEQYTSSIYAFINDLLLLRSTLDSATSKIVEGELFELMESPIDYVASRAEKLLS